MFSRPIFDLPDKTMGDQEHRHDGVDLVAAVVLAAGDQHLGQLGVQGELGHDGAHLGEVPVIIQRRQVVQHSHHGLQRRSTEIISTAAIIITNNNNN